MMTTVKGISIQQKLYELAKPILILLKVVGYFPYTTSKNFEITFTMRSLALIWSLFLLLLSSTKLVTYLVLNQMGKFVQMTPLAFVEGFCQILLTMVAISAVVLLTAKGIFSVRKAVNLWNLHYDRLQKFTNLGPHFDFCNEFGLYNKLFQRIKRRVWIMTVVSFVYGLSTPVIMQVLHVTPSGTPVDKMKSTALVNSTSTFVISCIFKASIPISFMYIGLTAYMIFFLQIYNACLTIVGEELKRIILELEGEETLKLFTIKSLGHLNGPLLSVLVYSDARMSTLQNCLRGYILIDELVDGFSKHFGFELIVETVKSFLCVLIYAFFILSKGVNFVGLVVCLGPMIALSWRSYGLTSEATKVKQSADVILRYLHQLDLDVVSPNLRLKVQMASMKILARPPSVMPGYFFTLDRQLLVSIISAMTTYLIILVQFKSTEAIQ